MLARLRVRNGFRPAVLGWLGVAALAVAARGADVLSHVPDTALAVVVVNNAEQGSAKVDELAGQLLLPPPSLLDLLTGQANVDEGLNRKGAVAAIVFAPESPGRPPRGVLLLPASDYDALIGQLEPGDTKDKKTPVELAGKAMVAAKVGDFAALVETDDEVLLDDVLAGKTSVGSQVGDETAKWLAAQDAYALATSGGIAMVTDQALEALKAVQQQLENFGDEQQAETIKLALGMYADLFAAAKSELSFAAAGVRGEKQGLHLTSRLAFKPGSDAAKLAASIGAPKRNLLAGLPDGKFVFAGGGEIPAKAAEGLYAWSAKMMKAMPGGKDLKQEDIDALMKLSAESMAGVQSMAMAMYAPGADAPLYGSVVGVMKVDDAEAFLANYPKTIEAMNALAKKTDSPFLKESKIEKTEVEGKPAVELTMSIPNTGGNDPVSAMLMEKMFGDTEHVKTYVVAADAKTIVLGYITPDAARRAIKESGGKGIAANANLSKSAELLPQGCQIVGFLSPKGAIDMVMDIVPGIEQTPAPALVGDFPATPPLGFGLKVTAAGLETDFVVPEETLEAIGGAIARARAVSIGTLPIKAR